MSDESGGPWVIGDLLLPKLISGQLDVEDLDIDVSMTAEDLTEAAAG